MMIINKELGLQQPLCVVIVYLSCAGERVPKLAVGSLLSSR